MTTHVTTPACDATTLTSQRRASAPVMNSQLHTKATKNTCCSGNRVNGCGCGCQGCCCQYNQLSNQSNRLLWTEGTGRNIPSPSIAVLGSEFATGSLVSTDSSHMDSGSMDNSYEVQDPLNDRLASDDFYRLNHKTLATTAIRNVAAAFDQSDEDDHPWANFVSRDSMAVDEYPEDILFDNMDASSMNMEYDEQASGTASMLSNYEMSFRRQSVTTSQVIAGTGASFSSNTFLPLTPELRGSNLRQLCESCAH